MPSARMRVSPMSTEGVGAHDVLVVLQGTSVSKVAGAIPVTFTTSSLVLPVKKESPNAELK